MPCKKRLSAGGAAKSGKRAAAGKDFWMLTSISKFILKKTGTLKFAGFLPAIQSADRSHWRCLQTRAGDFAAGGYRTV
jgi:hypothetical protein